MAEKTPLYMDINNVYSGDEMGLPNRDFISEGIVGSGDYLVSAGAGNTVNIAAGACWILGDTDVVNQPIYRVINDAVVNKGITPDPTNPRIVLVVGQITDATFSGATRAMVLTAIHGTPAASPVAPALPASAIKLATITVPAAAASSAAYTFVDNRTRATVGSGQALGASASAAFNGCIAHSSASLAVTSSVTTHAVHDTFDRNIGGYSFSGGRIVVPTTGYYRILGQVTWPANATGTRELLVYNYSAGGGANGIIGYQDHQTLATATAMGTQVEVIELLAGSQQISLALWQNSGGTLTIPAGVFSLYGNINTTVQFLGS